LNAIQALSQLSYTPIFWKPLQFLAFWTFHCKLSYRKAGLFCRSLALPAELYPRVQLTGFIITLFREKSRGKLKKFAKNAKNFDECHWGGGRGEDNF
jgi:hypothetical protein